MLLSLVRASGDDLDKDDTDRMYDESVFLGKKLVLPCVPRFFEYSEIYEYRMEKRNLIQTPAAGGFG